MAATAISHATMGEFISRIKEERVNGHPFKELYSTSLDSRQRSLERTYALLRFHPHIDLITSLYEAAIEIEILTTYLKEKTHRHNGKTTLLCSDQEFYSTGNIEKITTLFNQFITKYEACSREAIKRVHECNMNPAFEVDEVDLEKSTQELTDFRERAKDLFVCFKWFVEQTYSREKTNVTPTSWKELHEIGPSLSVLAKPYPEGRDIFKEIMSKVTPSPLLQEEYHYIFGF